MVRESKRERERKREREKERERDIYRENETGREMKRDTETLQTWRLWIRERGRPRTMAHKWKPRMPLHPSSG